MITIREVMTDPQLFGDQFNTESWQPWLALLCGFYGLALNRKEQRIFEAITKRSTSPQEACEELWLVVGRRGGKSNVAALLAVYTAAFQDFRDKLAPGEVATVMVLAADRKQARAVFRYVTGLIESNPMIAKMVVRQDSESIELSNRCVIEVTTASFRAVRGYSVAMCIADELAFWRSEDSANPDYEILNAIRPAMATLDGKLIVLSSPYARRGELWNTFKRYFGTDSLILVAQAPSRVMNPSLSQKYVDRAMERDAATASAEYMAQFRSDIEAFLSRDAVEGAARLEPMELPYDKNNKYFAFVDPAGGGQDEFTMAIGHREGKKTFVDVLRARRGTPATIVEEYAGLLKQYGLRKARSDRYAGTWPADEFKRHGITVEQSAKPKSDLYKDALSAFNSAQVEIPPDERLISQFIQLERRTSRGGRDSIDHPPGGHDDRANAVAGLITMKQAYKSPVAVFGTYAYA